MSLEAQSRAIHGKVQRNLNFAVARGLTRTAQFATQKMQQQLPAIFDRPTPFTQKSVGFQPAAKYRLEARVFIRDLQAKYLEMQEQGGLRKPMPGSPINIAVGQRLNQYGNISRGALTRQRAKPTVFVSRGKGKTKHLPPGLYERLNTRKAKGLGSKHGRKRIGGKVGRIKLLVAFERQARYQPRLRFVERVSKIARATVKQQISTSIAEAMRTMR